MKRIEKGITAYATMISAAVPEKTKTYTPISHVSVINRIRAEITNSGYIITGEDYRASSDGAVATGTFRLNYKADPDIELSANFLNSYNKQYAFRFNLGGMVKVCMNGMMMNNNKFGAYRRVHTASADILSEGMIKEYISNSGEYWDSLVEHKELFKDRLLSANLRNAIMGELFFDEGILNSMQMNIIKGELAKPSFDYKVNPDSAWALYNHATLAMKEAHPATWINDQTTLHDVFCRNLGIAYTPEPVAEPAAELELAF